MIELVFVACLMAEPSVCREQQLRSWNASSPATCMRYAPGSLAQWRTTHPKWRIRKWACRVHDPSATDI